MPETRTAIITKAVGGSFHVAAPDMDFQGLAQARGIFRKHKNAPVPGDKVLIGPSGDPDLPWVIEKILPRKNRLVRPPMANLDVLLVTLSRTDPVVDFALIDKLIALAVNLDVEPVLVLTKGDLDTDNTGLQTILYNYWSTGFPIFLTDADAAHTPEAFMHAFHGEIVAFAGQSGVGKSTFLNRLFGEELMAQGDLSEKIQRGKQTTRHIELFRFGKDNFLADTPGFQSLEIDRLELDLDVFDHAWPEIGKLSEHCRFHNCRHLEEPGCEIKDSILEEEDFSLPDVPLHGFIHTREQRAPLDWIARPRYERYVQLRKDYERSLRQY